MIAQSQHTVSMCFLLQPCSVPSHKRYVILCHVDMHRAAQRKHRGRDRVRRLMRAELCNGVLARCNDKKLGVKGLFVKSIPNEDLTWFVVCSYCAFTHRIESTLTACPANNRCVCTGSGSPTEGSVFSSLYQSTSCEDSNAYACVLCSSVRSKFDVER